MAVITPSASSSQCQPFSWTAHYAWIRLKEQLNIRVLWSYNSWFKIEQIELHQYCCMVHEVKHINPAYVYPWVKAVFYHCSGGRGRRVNQCHQKVQRTASTKQPVACASVSGIGSSCQTQQIALQVTILKQVTPLSLRNCDSAIYFTLAEPSYCPGICWNVAVSTSRTVPPWGDLGRGCTCERSCLSVFKLYKFTIHFCNLEMLRKQVQNTK